MNTILEKEEGKKERATAKKENSPKYFYFHLIIIVIMMMMLYFPLWLVPLCSQCYLAKIEMKRKRKARTIYCVAYLYKLHISCHPLKKIEYNVVNEGVRTAVLYAEQKYQ